MKLPKNWKQITISQFQQLQKFTEANYDNQMMTLAIVSGKNYDYIESLPKREVLKQLAKLSFMDDLPQPKDYKYCRIGFKRYRFAINQLDISGSRFVTVQDLFQSGNWVDNLHKIMAVMTLGKHDFEKTAELFRKKMPISIAYGYTLFFSTCYPELLHITQAYFKGVELAAMMHLPKKEQE